MRYTQVPGLIWMAIGITLLFGSIKLGLGTFQKPGPGFMPFFTGSLLGLLGLILAIISSRRKDKEDDKISLKKFFKQGVYALISSTIYIFVLDYFGFIIATFLFIFILLKIMGTRKWLTSILISLLTVGVSYLIFIFWLRINFPMGMLRIG